MSKPAKEINLLQKANSSGTVSKFFFYTKISGPGIWLALAALSAGSLVGSIGIGQRLGTGGLWIQALAMLLGIFSLWAISHIALNSQQSLFSLLKNEWNPSLGWWLAGSAMITNFAWCMPQFRLGADITGSVILPFLDNKGGKVGVAFCMLALSIFLSLWYERSGFQSKLLQWILRIILGALISCLVICVFITFPHSGISFGEILCGFLPALDNLSEVPDSFESILSSSGEYRSFWEEHLLSKQKELTLITFSSTLGVNLLFALPLLLLGRGWKREHSGFAKFNMFAGLFIPFVLCSSSVTLLSVIAHQNLIKETNPDIHNHEDRIEIPTTGPIHNLLAERISREIGQREFDSLPPFQQEEKISNLSNQEKMLARFVLHTNTKHWVQLLSYNRDNSIGILLGISILLISFSTIVILMLLNGHLVCEVLGKPHKGAAFQSGSLLLALSSVGPFIWSDQDNWVADPSYFLSLAIIPFALLSFILMLNSKELLGRQRPKGISGFILNSGAILAFCCLGMSSFYLVWNHMWENVPIGRILVILLGILLLIGYFSLKNRKLANRIAGIESRLERMKN